VHSNPEDIQLEQAVIVHLRLSDGGFGSLEDRDCLFELQDKIAAAIQAADAGELDGDEFGEGECVLFMYGPSADRLFAAIEPLLRSSLSAVGGYAIKRYGEASERSAAETRVDL
jgi:hypothetical protein